MECIDYISKVELQMILKSGKFTEEQKEAILVAYNFVNS